MQDRTERQLKRRSKLETYFSIIEVVGAGNQKPTHIMYKANLSWVVMQDYIRNLESRGVVESAEAEGRKSYHLTQRGFELLAKYLEIKENMNIGEGLPQTIPVS
jgi:predicted transcriptional regulator